MNPKIKLIFLSVASVIMAGFAIHCVMTGNIIGLIFDVTAILIWYVPHIIFAIQDIKRLNRNR